jgi:hypothetical protein
VPPLITVVYLVTTRPRLERNMPPETNAPPDATPDTTLPPAG